MSRFDSDLDKFFQQENSIIEIIKDGSIDKLIDKLPNFQNDQDNFHQDWLDWEWKSMSKDEFERNQKKNTRERKINQIINEDKEIH